MAKFLSNSSLEDFGGTVGVWMTQIPSIASTPIRLTICHNELGIEIASCFPWHPALVTLAG